MKKHSLKQIVAFGKIVFIMKAEVKNNFINQCCICLIISSKKYKFVVLITQALHWTNMPVMALMSWIVLLLNCQLVPHVGPNIMMLESVTWSLLQFAVPLVPILILMFSFIFYALRAEMVGFSGRLVFEK